MARISSYPRDLAIGGSEVLLGSDSDGSTKTFSIDDLKDFLISQGVSGKIIYKFDNITATSALPSGSFKSDSTTFSSINTLNIHVNHVTGSNITTYLNTFLDKEIFLFNIKDRNNFARFSFGPSYSVNSNNNNLRDVEVSHVSSNGSLQQDGFYSFGFEGKDKHYTHHQNNASVTWNISHNLNKFPSVSLKFSSSDNIYQNVGALGGVVYTDKNNLTINLVTAESGYAYLN